MFDNYQYSRKLSLSLLLFLLTTVASYAQTLKGNVADQQTGEQLIGASVHIEKGSSIFNTAVKLDGSYQFKNIPAGIYKVQAKFVGYKTSKVYTIEVSASQPAVLNLGLIDNSSNLTEVAITAHANKESENSARNAEKKSDNTLNAVSAASIATSPDVIVSAVLSRVSGISIDRNSTGDAQHVIIRGMNKQYNTTLINGIKIPSPDNKNRYVPLDIFPADLVEKIEVFKSLTPNMEGDASGGVVNLVMKSAPDKLRIDGSLGTGYSQIFADRGFSSFDRSTQQNQSPGEKHPGTDAAINEFPYQNLITRSRNAPPNLNASLTLGNRYLNNKLGVLLSGTYQNTYQGGNSLVFIQGNTVSSVLAPNGQNTETAFQSSYNRQYSSQVSRLGTIASVDYKFNANHTINLFGSYLQLNEYRVRQTETANYSGYSYMGYKSTNSIDDVTETRTDKQHIYNITLKGQDKITKDFSLDWTLADSKANHEQPDIASFKTTYKTSPDPSGQNVADPNSPGSSVFVTPAIIKDPTLVGNESRIWTHNTDKDLSAYLNMHYDATIFGRKTTFSAGGMYRHKTRDNYVNSYSLPNTLSPGTSSAEPFVSIPASTFDFTLNPANARGSYASDAGVYTFSENIQSEYVMAKYVVSNRFDVSFGVRAENTQQSYVSNLPPAVFVGASARFNYTDYLASINAKYTLNDEQAIRASFFQSNLRPAFADLIPYPDALTDNPYLVKGNPFLQHTTVNNYDLRYEFFPGIFDEFMAGVFYKDLSNPIETVLTAGVLSPQNLASAHNYGAELNAKKFFGNIGASFNYTYTQSNVTTAKQIILPNIGLTSRDQTRPLQGQAAHIGNVSLLYKNQHLGLDAQLSLSYTGERIAAVSQFYNLDTWEKASTFLDFSAQKQLGKHFIIFAKANNLLNTPYQLFIKQDNTSNYSGLLKYAHQESAAHTTVQYDQYYARYNLGVKFKF